MRSVVWWNTLPLEALDPGQWEALCDGCGKCCLHKLGDTESEAVRYTGIRCRYLNGESCRCGDYEHRTELVADCVRITPDNIDELTWLPGTCAYRLRARGLPLPWWHPLVTGEADSVHRAGMSVQGRTISDEYVHPDGYDEHIIHWVQE